MRKYGVVLLIALGLFLYFYFTPFSNDEKKAADEGRGVLSKTETMDLEDDKVIDWNGEWNRVDHNSEGELRISTHEGDSFNFAISVSSGENTADMEGVADVDGNKATYIDTAYDTGCRLDMTLNEDAILIDPTPECWEVGGVGTYFEGDYLSPEKADSLPENTLSSLDLLTPEQDAVVQELVGTDYEVLVSHMGFISNGEEYGLQESMIVEGAVQGMYTIMESIIIINMFGDYNVASIIDGEKIKFYTNEEGYQDQLPSIIEQWSQSFSDYPVEYIYKDVKE